MLTLPELADLLFALQWVPDEFRAAVVGAYGLDGDHPDAWLALSPQQAADITLAAAMRGDLEEAA